jgi:hypothetical protein
MILIILIYNIDSSYGTMQVIFQEFVLITYFCIRNYFSCMRLSVGKRTGFSIFLFCLNIVLRFYLIYNQVFFFFFEVQKRRNVINWTYAWFFYNVYVLSMYVTVVIYMEILLPWFIYCNRSICQSKIHCMFLGEKWANRLFGSGNPS